MINIIVAIAENNAIGCNNNLLWHISDDLKYFKKTTLGYPVVMGRKTWDSLPFKPLPKRENIVISSNKDLVLEGALVIYSLNDAIDYCNALGDCFVIGGGRLYHQMLPFAQRLYITKVHKSFDADTFFPQIDDKQWQLISNSELLYDEKEDVNYEFLVYQRI